MEKNPSEQKPMKVFEPQTTEIQHSCTEQLIGLGRAGMCLRVGATTSICSPTGCWGQPGKSLFLLMAEAHPVNNNLVWDLSPVWGQKLLWACRDATDSPASLCAMWCRCLGTCSHLLQHLVLCPWLSTSLGCFSWDGFQRRTEPGMSTWGRH